ncbi:MAG: IS110 family transposase [Actinobacteria bacterium]|nr:IS110 family transposase [Actinomycetota bacterium]
MSAQVVEDEDYRLRHEAVAGIDVAKDSGMVCLRLPPAEGRARRSSRTQEVAARVPDIAALAAELKAAGVELVSMESTSDYWRIWFAVLEEAGLAVQLVNSSQARNLPGRPKTDKADAQWIARLTEMGLLRPSFVPPAEIRALRVYTRQLVHLAADRARCWQRLEKLLEDALCKLSSVVSKLAGSESCRAMIEAMIAGVTDPEALAGLARGRMRDKRGALARAFTGMRFGDQHAAAAASHLRAIDFLDAEIAALEQRVREHIAAIPAAWGVDAGGATGPGAGHGEDAEVLPAVARLAEIPGVSEMLAIGLIAEIGLDMSRFPTPGHLVSWAGMAPVAHQSGPRRGKGKKGQGNSYARRAATAAGNGAARTDTFLGERHRRLRTRPGGGGWKKASCAVGRSILVIVWHLLKDPQARYADLGPDHYAKHADTGRKVRGHIRQLQALGLDVTVTPKEQAA